MTLVTLRDVLTPAMAQGYAVCGVVCLGWEDARAYVAAAEAENCPLILQAGPGCRAHTPLAVVAPMLLHLAETASVPVVVHLDHGYGFDEVREAIDRGFTSVMYDGSRHALAQNIDETAAIAAFAHAAGISCEGEIGVVGYLDGGSSAGTDPAEAAVFARETGIDAMAVSVGNMHLQRGPSQPLDEALLRAIEAVTDVPLVIHGGTGVPMDQRRTLAQTSNICKFNIGTELRMAFGQALRLAVNADRNRFDRIAILRETHDPVVAATRRVLRGFGAPPQR
jgi:fructose-bisphosphate aldolase, class II